MSVGRSAARRCPRRTSEKSAPPPISSGRRPRRSDRAAYGRSARVVIVKAAVASHARLVDADRSGHEEGGQPDDEPARGEVGELGQGQRHEGRREESLGLARGHDGLCIRRAQPGRLHDGLRQESVRHSADEKGRRHRSRMTTPMSSPESLVHARGLTKRYANGFTAVDAVDFDVRPGKAFGFRPERGGQDEHDADDRLQLPVTEGS